MTGSETYVFQYASNTTSPDTEQKSIDTEQISKLLSTTSALLSSSPKKAPVAHTKKSDAYHEKNKPQAEDLLNDHSAHLKTYLETNKISAAQYLNKQQAFLASCLGPFKGLIEHTEESKGLLEKFKSEQNSETLLDLVPQLVKQLDCTLAIQFKKMVEIDKNKLNRKSCEAILDQKKKIKDRVNTLKKTLQKISKKRVKEPSCCAGRVIPHEGLQKAQESYENKKREIEETMQLKIEQLESLLKGHEYIEKKEEQ